MGPSEEDARISSNEEDRLSLYEGFHLENENWKSGSKRDPRKRMRHVNDKSKTGVKIKACVKTLDINVLSSYDHFALFQAESLRFQLDW